MRTFAAAVVLLFAAICTAQDSSTSAADQGSRQSVAAAVQANRARVQQDQSKQADIRRLLQVTGAAGLATQSMDEMQKTMRPLITNALPAGEYRDKLVDLFFAKFHSKRDPEQLINLIVPLYDKYYSDDEIEELIQMYQTPLGQKMLSVLPKILAESQAAGRTWGEQIGRESMMEVLAEHPEMEKAIEEAKKNQSSGRS